MRGLAGTMVGTSFCLDVEELDGPREVLGDVAEIVGELCTA